MFSSAALSHDWLWKLKPVLMHFYYVKNKTKWLKVDVILTPYYLFLKNLRLVLILNAVWLWR